MNRPYAFFFDADHSNLDGFYGPPCTAKVIRALESVDSPVQTLIQRGDALVLRLAYEISEVSVDADRIGGGTSHVESGDPALLRLIACDFADSLTWRWHSLNPVDFPLYAERHNMWTVLLPTISENVAQHIDVSIEGFGPYLGAAEIDRGNPLQLDILRLPSGAFYDSGDLYYSNSVDYEEQPDILQEMYGSTELPILLSSAQYDKRAPPRLTQGELSQRGRLSKARLAPRKRKTHKQKIAYMLLDWLDSQPTLTDFRFTVDLEGTAGEFLCEEKKFTNYLLDLSHPKGRSKARFFVDTLGIEPEDWFFLADQIKLAMSSAVLSGVKDGEHGVTHTALMKIRGRSGREVVIETGWHLASGQSTRLVTAYPFSGHLDVELEVPPQRVVPLTLTGDARWAEIYRRADAAGILAAADSVPTPMIVEGYAPVFAGPCGFAWVVVRDARRGMARWMKLNGIGSKNFTAGWYLSADPEPPEEGLWDTQSINPKVAYASAFADVLQANGVECEAEYRFD